MTCVDPSGYPARRGRTVFLLSLLLSAVLFVYLGHFRNSFHFDDLHTIVQNPYIRDPHNIPRFFTDARMFSIKPTNRTYRPLVSASVAIDYWLGGGLDPFYFHLSTFGWFMLQLALMYGLFRNLCDRARPDARNRNVGLLATAIYGLHPAMAETVNYVIQRGDLYSTLGVIAAILIYASWPEQRKFGLYLLPATAAILCKPPALIFPAILLIYVWLFEEEYNLHGLRRALVRCAPAFILTAALAVFSAAMTPKEFTGGALSAYAYRITQPFVALRYFRTFFAPGWLSADTDLSPIAGLWRWEVWLGFLFVIGVATLAWFCARSREWRPVAFGLWWFLLALVPTSIFPLAEVENDHRMFFPFVGLALSVCWPVALWWYDRQPGRAWKIGFAAFLSVEFLLLALGTMQRNLVWKNEETLWRDVTVKSPRNPRGLMNYASVLAEKGNCQEALGYLQRAQKLSPRSGLIELNLAAVEAKLGWDADAEQRFLRAVQMLPDDPRGRYIYGDWLQQKSRQKDAIEQLRLAVKQNPDFLDSVYLLIRIFAKRGSWATVQRLADYVLQRFPADVNAQASLLMGVLEEGGKNETGRALSPIQTAQNYLNVSVLYYQAGNYEKAITAAEEALKRRPDYADAYNNMAAAYRGLERWDSAAGAASQALRIRPGFRAARQNLIFSKERKR